MDLFKAFSNLFTKNKIQDQSKQVLSLPVLEEIQPEIEYQVSQCSASILSRDLATALALDITSVFEGHDGFGNVVGNFDGMGLSCGALCFTWATGVQQELVNEATARHPFLIKKMPTYGQQYSDLARRLPQESFDEICRWSTHGYVRAEIKAELKAFWTSDEMVAIQTKHAEKIGQNAYHYAANWSQSIRNLIRPSLLEFVYFFDICVQHGSIDIDYLQVKNFLCGTTPAEVFRSTVQHWSQRPDNNDSLRNATLWSENLNKFTDDQIMLALLGYLRMLHAKSEFQAQVMNRRGSLALMIGYCNGELKRFDKSYPTLLKDLVV